MVLQASKLIYKMSPLFRHLYERNSILYLVKNQITIICIEK